MICRGHSIFRLRNISRAQLPRKERRTDTKIEKFYAMVNHNLEFLETSSRIWCCLAAARQQLLYLSDSLSAAGALQLQAFSCRIRSDRDTRYVF